MIIIIAIIIIIINNNNNNNNNDNNNHTLDDVHRACGHCCDCLVCTADFSLLIG